MLKMFINNFLFVHLKKKSYFWFGIVVGIFLSFNYSSYESFFCNENLHIQTNDFAINEFNNKNTYQPKANLAKKPLSPKKASKSFVRPRYYSTELGIREKLFVGVLTSFENLETVGLAINVTLSHIADKIKYFVQAIHGRGHPPPISNVVGFTDNRETNRAFHVFKYISDNFLQEYDYFFLMTDATYINGRKLRNIVNKISITKNVYMGSKLPDSSYCSLDFGILFSNSVIKLIKDNLEWCVRNAVSHENSDNIGRCVVHASKSECLEEIQGQEFHSYKSKYFGFTKHLQELASIADFKNAVSIHPVLDANDMYILHNYYSKQTLTDIQQEINFLKTSILETIYLQPKGFQNITWPVGDKASSIPATRYDIKHYVFFNKTHVYMKDDFSTITKLSLSERQDIDNVLEAAIIKLQYKYNEVLKYNRFVQGYKVFDESRGLDYVLDLAFKNLTTGKEIIRRVHACKILGRIEILPIPYVTENTRVTILLPVKEKEIFEALKFITDYSENIMTRREKTLLMIVFLYKNESPSKGSDDIFKELKRSIQKTTDKQKNSNSKIAWVSIRLPPQNFTCDLEKHKLMNFIVIDLALKMIGLDALILTLDLNVDLRYDFLNRVRMNTISGFQIFGPIPFKQYDPSISHQEDLDINKNIGFYDKRDYQYISFYSRDYVKTRKQMEYLLPIVRTDKDIINILQKQYFNFGNIFEFLLKYNKELHCFRAVEPSLKIKYHENELHNTSSMFASKVQFAKLILEYFESNSST